MIVKPRLTIQEVDGSPTGKPGTLKFPNGTLTDNGDGTYTFTPAAAGGQSTYDAIVAPSGGDYTTLGAAIAAASNGWSIFVKEGTYVESAITTSLTNLRIVGESRETATCGFSTNAAAFSGVGVQFENIGFTVSTGRLSVTGNNSTLRNVKLVASGHPAATACLNIGGTNSYADGIYFESTVTSSTSATPQVQLASAGCRLINSYLRVNTLGSSVNAINLNATNCVIANCNIDKYTSGENGGTILAFQSNECSVIGNRFTNWTSSTLRAIYALGNESQIVGNFIEGVKEHIRLEQSFVNVVGNTFYNVNGSTGYGVYDTYGDCNITGNTFYPGSGTVYGVYLAGTASNTVISNNRIYGFGTAIQLSSGSTDCVVSGNATGGGPTVTDSGTRTSIVGNGALTANKLQGTLAVQAGNSTSYPKVGGNLFSYNTDVGNGTTVETDLYSDAIPGNSLSTDKNKIEAVYAGITVSHATATRQLKVYYAGTAIFDSTALVTTTAADWIINVLPERVSSSVVRCVVRLNITGGLTQQVYVKYTELTGLTLSGATTLKVTGQAGAAGAATNDIVAKLGNVEWKPAP